MREFKNGDRVVYAYTGYTNKDMATKYTGTFLKYIDSVDVLLRLDVHRDEEGDGTWATQVQWITHLYSPTDHDLGDIS